MLAMINRLAVLAGVAVFCLDLVVTCEPLCFVF